MWWCGQLTSEALNLGCRGRWGAGCGGMRWWALHTYAVVGMCHSKLGDVECLEVGGVGSKIANEGVDVCGLPLFARLATSCVGVLACNGL